MKVGSVISPLLLLKSQACNSWSQQCGCCWLPSLCLEQLHPFRDAVTWDTQVPAIWMPAGCINTDRRTWEDRDMSRTEDCWQFPHPPWRATSSLQVARQNHGTETSGLLHSDHCVYPNVAWKHQASTGLLDTLNMLGSLLPLCLCHKRCILHTGTLPWIGAEQEWKESNHKTYSDWEWDQDICKDSSGPA